MQNLSMLLLWILCTLPVTISGVLEFLVGALGTMLCVLVIEVL
jgi:hypothetical protein